MIFTKEIIENAGLLYFKDSPPTNDLDLSCLCQGLITQDLFRSIIEHYMRLGLQLYVIYIPDSRKYDICRWIPINIIEDGLIYNTIKNNENIFLPKIKYVEELEGEEFNKIYCHAIGVKNIGEWPKKDIFSFGEAKGIFGEGVNWVHVKIG